MPQFDYIYVFWKVGDKQTAKGNEHLGLKDGMPICYIDPNKWNPEISDHMRKVFLCTKEPIERKDFFINALKPNQDEDDINEDTYRARKCLINFTELELKTGRLGLVNDLRSSRQVEIIDCTVLDKPITKTSDILNPTVNDFNSVSEGNYTFGSGGNYLTPELAFADISDLTNNLLFAQTSNIISTAVAAMTENLNGYTFTVTSNTPHYGDNTAGWLLSINHNSFGFTLNAGNDGTIEIKNLRTKRTTAASTGGISVIYFGSTSGFTANIHDNLIDGNTLEGAGIRTTDSDVLLNIYNNEIWDYSTANGGILIDPTDGNASSKYENNTILNCNYGINAGNNSGTFKNNISVNSDSADFTNTGSATGNNNVSTDVSAADGNWSSGSNNQASITVADEFVSTTDTDSTFLKLKSDGVCFDNGTTPGIVANTTGIRGNNRPWLPSYSIGADEFENHDWSLGQVDETIGSGQYRANLAAFEAAHDGETPVNGTLCIGRLIGADSSTGIQYWNGWQAGQDATTRIVLTSQTGQAPNGLTDATGNKALVQEHAYFNTGQTIWLDIINLEWTNGSSAIDYLSNGRLLIAKSVFRDMTGRGIQVTSQTSATTIYIGGSLFKFLGTSAHYNSIRINNANITADIINCTVVGTTGAACEAIQQVAGTLNCKNVAAANNTVDFDGTIAETTCKSEDDGDITYDDFDDFYKPSIEDYRVYNPSSQLYHSGTAVADSWFTTHCSTDLLDHAWASPNPSVGCFEYYTPVIPVLINSYRQRRV